VRYTATCCCCYPIPSNPRNSPHQTAVWKDRRIWQYQGFYIYFSDVTRYSDTIDDSNGMASVRLALFYLIYKTCSPSVAAWRISNNLDAPGLKDQWIATRTTNDAVLATPFAGRTLPLVESVVADLVDRVSYLDLQTPQRRSTGFSATPAFSSPPPQLGSYTPYNPPAGSRPPSPSDRVLRSHRDRP